MIGLKKKSVRLHVIWQGKNYLDKGRIKIDSDQTKDPKDKEHFVLGELNFDLANLNMQIFDSYTYIIKCYSKLWSKHPEKIK